MKKIVVLICILTGVGVSIVSGAHAQASDAHRTFPGLYPCEDAPVRYLAPGTDPQATSMSYSDPNSGTITGICFVSDLGLHSGLVTQNGQVVLTNDSGNSNPADCYTVSGIGTSTVTVTSKGIFKQCSPLGFSHIDAYGNGLAANNKPTVTASPRATAKPTPAPTVEPTIAPTIQPKPSVTASLQPGSNGGGSNIFIRVFNWMMRFLGKKS